MHTRTRPSTRTSDRPRLICAGIYLRLSYAPDGSTAGVDRQEEDDRALAKAKRWKVGRVYCDNDKSATGDKVRPDFEELIKDIEEGRINAIIVWHLDRLVRKMSDLVRIIEAGQQHGLNIATVHGVSLDLGDPTGIAVAQILTAIAAMEVAHKAERQVRSNVQRAENGQQNVTRAFGFNTDGTVREAEALLVREVFRRFTTGAPISELAKYLTASGIKAAGSMAQKSTTGWHRTGVRSVLRNRRYVGEVWYRGEFVRMGTWTPLVDPDTFAAAQARLDDPTRTTTTGPARRYLGGGLFRCSVCAAAGVEKSTIYTHSTVSRGRSWRYYLCKPDGDLHVSHRMEWVDTYVKDEIVRRLNDPTVRAAGKSDRNESAARALVDERNALQGKEDAIALDQVSDDPSYTPRQVKLMTAKLHQRMATIESELADLGQRSALAGLAGEKDPGAAWMRLDVHQAAAVVDALAVITLHPRSGRGFSETDVQIEWR